MSLPWSPAFDGLYFGCAKAPSSFGIGSDFCHCDNPNNATGLGRNGYTCDDGNKYNCSATQTCINIGVEEVFYPSYGCQDLCTCDNINGTGSGHNSYTCTDGRKLSCSGNRTCIGIGVGEISFPLLGCL